jgi:hypothetical protein
MKIEYHNDGKGKYQSWTAKLVLNGDLDSSTQMITLEAYGPHKEQATHHLIKQILQTTIDLLGVIEKL